VHQVGKKTIIIITVKLRSLRWAGYVARMEDNAGWVPVGIPKN